MEVALSQHVDEDDGEGIGADESAFYQTSLNLIYLLGKKLCAKGLIEEPAHTNSFIMFFNRRRIGFYGLCIRALQSDSELE